MLDTTKELKFEIAEHYVDQGLKNYKAGDLELALKDFNSAIEIEPNNALAYNNICWTGSLLGRAADVLDACYQAVELDPSNALVYDSRGLARALTGDYAGAIEDFEIYLAWLKETDRYEEGGQELEFWIDELNAGRNPFDDATLESLR